jgi:Ca2+-binding EF-hand superfamily protein
MPVVWSHLDSRAVEHVNSSQQSYTTMKTIAVATVALGLSWNLLHSAEGDTKAKAVPPIPEWAKTYDINGDGKLDPQERTAAVTARRQEAIKKYDKNGDGKIDSDEQKAMSDARKKERDEAMAKREADLKKKEEKKEDKKEIPK